MREREKERQKKESDTKSYPHDYKRNKSFHERGKEKRKVMQLPAYVFLFFFILAGTYTLHSTLYTTLQLQLLSYWVFLYEII